MVDKLACMSGTPMMQQYQSIRRSLPKGTLLLFRLGDFYELFFDDAKLAADILGVALTKRNGMPMCGVPFHAAEAYIGKLIKAGHRVAICDQVSEPQPGKIVERKVSQIISPGTVSDLNLLESKRNNFLAAINHAKNRFGLALIDVSTGEFRVAEMDSQGALQDELARFSPTELIRPDTMDGFAEGTVYDGYAFEIEQATEMLREQFQVQSLDGFGCASLVAGVGAAGAIIHYLKNQLRRSTEHILAMGVYLADEFVALDATTHSHLELVGRRDDRRDTSLLRALDRTVTPMGARLLRESILKPLRNLEKIRRRQGLVARFLEQPFLLNACRESMRGVRDVERTLSRVSQGTGGPRDLAAIRHSLEALPPLVDHLTALGKSALFARESSESAKSTTSTQSTTSRAAKEDLSSEATPRSAPLVSRVAQEDLSSEATPLSTPLASRAAKEENSLCYEILCSIHLLPELLERLQAAIEDEPPATVKEGGIFRSGYDADLDELRQMSGSGKEWIAELQQKEIDRTGIKSLKVRYNSVFGYFIEITKANLGAVPADYIRKQTTVNGERFITPELKEFEAKVLGADERSKQLEYQLFLKLREFTLGYLGPLQETARAVAQLDFVASLAESARLFGYCQPEISTDSVLHIVEGRHPVLDQNLTEEKFVPNDCLLDGETNRLLLITGPNMAGKSTYIRQVALLVLMAQIGSFIPAKSATVGIVDRIFTRVGASDDLARGQSTFMVEMNETANIVNNATERSLIILDEIGRGTSTFDGLSIAWSVAEYLHDVVRARTLFATHYHEMTELEMVCAGVKNFNVAVREWNDRIIFLRKIQKGAADKSYGIQVARLAGLPVAVIDRAKEILANLESAELNAQGRPRLAEAKSTRRKAKTDESRPQPTLFDFQPGDR